MSFDHLWCGVVQKRNAKGTKVLVSNVESLLSFPRVSSRGTLSLSAKALLSLCLHFLFTGNSFDFWFDSSETFAKSFDSFAIYSSVSPSSERRANARNVSTSHLPYGGITYLINWFDLSSSRHQLRHCRKKVAPVLRVCGIPHCT